MLLTKQLLSAHRPLQVTTDLHHLSDGYAEVRKEMRAATPASPG